MNPTYRLMIHFAIATMHFYREDIIPLKEGETLDVFYEKNKAVIKRVDEEALNLFNYELSYHQIGKAIAAYCAKPQSVTNSKAAVLS